jgi:hypothetical protein
MKVAVALTLIVAGSSVAFGQTPIKEIASIHSANASAVCRGGDLSVRHITEDAAMGGHNTIDYAFKNDSSSPCTLKGYPRFELLDRSGRVPARGRAINSQQLPGDETRQPPRLVNLAPGQEALFQVYYNNGGAGYIGKPCPLSQRVRIMAPGTRRSFVRREEIRSCGSVLVSAVRNSRSQQAH